MSFLDFYTECDSTSGDRRLSPFDEAATFPLLGQHPIRKKWFHLPFATDCSESSRLPNSRQSNHKIFTSNAPTASVDWLEKEDLIDAEFGVLPGRFDIIHKNSLLSHIHEDIIEQESKGLSALFFSATNEHYQNFTTGLTQLRFFQESRHLSEAVRHDRQCATTAAIAVLLFVVFVCYWTYAVADD